MKKDCHSNKKDKLNGGNYLEKQQEFYSFIKFGVVVIFLCVLFTPALSIILNKLTDLVFSTHFIMYEYNILDLTFIKWTMNVIVGGYALTFALYLLITVFKSLLLDKMKVNFSHFMGVIYAGNIFAAGFFFVSGSHIGQSLLIWSCLLIFTPFIGLKVLKNLP